ncbi:MAG: Holliday junction ATP-dependent DNA helicase RuvA [Gammaproteobacteria bacterium]|nr:MAG: Holliday junction ATP-dependent DNA helicase RuvA [Gammaproteobacteria bacterium]
MIGRLSGTLVSKRPPRLLLDVAGVGYELEAPMSTFYVLPEAGAAVTLLVHTHVREDAIALFGFASETERELFRTLIRVNGIGVRMALAILSGMDPERFVNAIHEGDHRALTRVPGIGRKTAERIVVELRDRLGEAGAPAAAVTAPGPAAPAEQAVEALVALGYRPAEAERLVAAVPAAQGGDVETLIRLALKQALK